MSEQSQGEGWWQASDGKWYPPPRPDVAPPPTTQPFETPPAAWPGPGGYGPPAGPPIGPPAAGPVGGKKPGIGRGPILGIVLAAVVIGAAVVAFFVTRDNGNTNNASNDRSVQSDQTDRSSPSNESDESASIPSDFKVIKDDASGVSIAVPNNFTEVDPSSLLNNANRSDLSSQNPELAPFVSADNPILRGSVLAAAGSADGTPAFVLVAKSPQRFDPNNSQSASDLESELQSELGAAGASDISVDKVTLPAGDALRATLTLDINAAASSGAVHETIYFATVGRTTWIIFGVAVGDSAGVDFFDQIAKSFSVGS
jgi:hypothetical protein